MIIAAALLALLTAQAGQSAPPPPTPDVVPDAADGFPDRDGPFSAMLTPIAEAQAAEFDKPSDQGPVINVVQSARRGDIVHLKLVFAGPKVGADGRIDVTYDLKILAPGGGLYDNLDRKGLQGAQGPVADAGGIFNNQTVVAIRFEPTDPLGPYRIEAMVHDNVANRHVPLKATVALTD